MLPWLVDKCTEYLRPILNPSQVFKTTCSIACRKRLDCCLLSEGYRSKCIEIRSISYNNKTFARGIDRKRYSSNWGDRPVQGSDWMGDQTIARICKEDKPMSSKYEGYWANESSKQYGFLPCSWMNLFQWCVTVKSWRTKKAAIKCIHHLEGKVNHEKTIWSIEIHETLCVGCSRFSLFCVLSGYMKSPIYRFLWIDV